MARTILLQRLVNGLEDLLIATGDVSTDGTQRSLSIAKQFFDLFRVHEDGRFATWGLAVPKQRRIILPGNHDRYGDYFLPYESATNRELERIFELNDEYPYVVGYRRPESNQHVAEPTILFYVFDSTLTRDPAESLNPMKRIARGLVTREDCDRLEEMANDLRRERQVRGLDGEFLSIDYENTVRVALLHHHPVRKQKRGLFQLLDKQSWSVMEEADRFIDTCFKVEIDLVLFGHEHENYNEEEQREVFDGGTKRVHTIRFVCCPSTTEYSEEKNGFYVIGFDANEYRMTLHEWTGTAYVASRTYSQPYNRPLTLVTRTSRRGA